MKMRKLILILLPLVLLAGCSNSPDYAKQLETWQNEQLNVQQAKYVAQIQDMQSQMSAKDKEVAQLQADKTNLSNQVKQLQGQLAMAPKQQDYTALKQLLANTNTALVNMTNQQAETQRRVNALATTEYELTRKLNESKAQYQELQGKIQAVTDKTDLTTTTNLTAEKRAHFYEMWNILKLLPE